METLTIAVGALVALAVGINAAQELVARWRQWRAHKARERAVINDALYRTIKRRR